MRPGSPRDLKQMGKKHVELGVADDVYGWVGASLLAALAVAAFGYWSPGARDSLDGRLRRHRRPDAGRRRRGVAQLLSGEDDLGPKTSVSDGSASMCSVSAPLTQ